MTAGERDKKMDEIATKAATEYCRNHQNDTDEQIRFDPETYLKHSIPYLTVRTLHRHEKALKGLEADSRWIKFLTIALVILTIVLAYYAWRLDAVIHAQRESVPQRMTEWPTPQATPPGVTAPP